MSKDISEYTDEELMKQAVGIARAAKTAEGGLDQESKQLYTDIMQEVAARNLNAEVTQKIAAEGSNLSEWKDRTSNNRGTFER